MRLSDFLNPKTGPEAIVRLAICPFLVVIVGGVLMGLVSQMNNTAVLLLVLLLLLLIPLAYALRKQRRGHRQERRSHRGAERTPLLPHEEEREGK